MANPFALNNLHDVLAGTLPHKSYSVRIIKALLILVPAERPLKAQLTDMTSPEFSIVVPLYNKASEIRRCLCSVLGQTYTKFELIVIDDGSTDGGDAVVRSIQDLRLKLLQQENQGLAETRNNGVRASGSQIVAFLDADDEWLPNHLEEMARLARLHPQAGVFSTGFWLDRGRGWRRRVQLAKSHLKPGTSLVADYFSIPDGKILPSATAVRKDALSAAGGYRTMFGEDVDLLLRMAAMFPVAYTPRATAIWHLDAKNRMCVEKVADVKLHQPASLLPSLHTIESQNRIPIETRYRARDYVAARERKAILDTLLHGHREHAVGLYGRWQKDYGQQSVLSAILLKFPCLILKVFGRCLEYFRRVKSITKYVTEQAESRRVFGSGW